MARPDIELAESKSKCKLLKKRIDVILNNVKHKYSLKPMHIRYVKRDKNVQRFFPQLCAEIIENARHELIDCHGAYIDITELYENYNFPSLENEVEQYTDLMLLFASLTISDLDPIDLITTVEPIYKGESGFSIQQAIESSYHELIIPLYIYEHIDRFDNLIKQCSKLMYSRTECNRQLSQKNISEEKLHLFVLPENELTSNINLLKIELDSLLGTISEFCDVIDPFTGEYYACLKRKHDRDLSMKRASASKKRVRISDDAKVYLEDFYLAMCQYISTQQRDDIDVVNVCLKFMQGHYYIADLSVKEKLKRNLSLFKQSCSSHEDVNYRYAFQMIAKSY
ncbi:MULTISPECIES: hypothetical protein [unclassified Photobacterium]|uniref:hypothetical protein n=1 Tax=unclassified Photobacterium TaxID=2628852 RepID=UPI001EE088F7|nr:MULTISPECIES: hypothetical protein [unclassified Photobacterium]MCG3864481.1 hypothetical protein [Photobacterium sp. Ph6]MCG3877444.1 hypothetical protein [Photobacterium sp. Ph5]